MTQSMNFASAQVISINQIKKGEINNSPRETYKKNYLDAQLLDHQIRFFFFFIWDPPGTRKRG